MTDDLDEAARATEVGDHSQPVTPELLGILNADFADLIEEGAYHPSVALRQEADEPHLKDLPRLICTKKRGLSGRFRQMIDCVNAH